MKGNEKIIDITSKRFTVTSVFVPNLLLIPHSRVFVVLRAPG